MKNIGISMQNTLLSEAIAKSLRETGDFRIEQIPPGKTGDTLAMCRALQAQILFMEVSCMKNYSLESRMQLIREVREAVSGCKFALICDENSNEDLAYQVMRARQDQRIDAFFYTSVTPAYLTAALEAM